MLHITWTCECMIIKIIKSQTYILKVFQKDGNIIWVKAKSIEN